jgi:hypothetical protein
VSTTGDARASRAKTLLVLSLLAGSALSFAVSEDLKVTRGPLTAVHVGRVLSPVCRCRTNRVRIAFTLTRGDRVSVSIVNSTGRVVRTLTHELSLGRGKHTFIWTGLTDDGRRAADGTYDPRVVLARARRTYTFPTPIAVDTSPPRIVAIAVRPRVISRRREGGSNGVRVSYVIDKRAHAVLHVEGEQAVRTRFARTRGALNWYGRVRGRVLQPGRYRIAVSAVDQAGNRSATVQAGIITIRQRRA